jgi:hypothetical protein
MRSIPFRWSLLGVVLIAIVVYGGTGLVRAVRASGAGHDHTVFSAQLPNVPGKTLTAIVVEYGRRQLTSAPSCWQRLRLCTLRRKSLGESRDWASAGLSRRAGKRGYRLRRSPRQCRRDLRRA